MTEQPPMPTPTGSTGPPPWPVRRRRTARSVAILEDNVVAALVWRNGLRLGLIPQMRLNDGQWAAAAVSFDLVHPRRGLLAPELTSVVIRRTGLELLLFHRLVARTISLQRQLHARGVELPTSVPVSAAVLAAQDGMRTDLEDRMRACGLPPDLLRLNVLTAGEAYVYPSTSGEGPAWRGGGFEFEVPAPIAASIAHINA